MLTTFALSAAAISSACQIASTAAYCFVCMSIGAAIMPLHIKYTEKS